MKLSFVIPVYDERETLTTLYEGIAANLNGHDAEIIFVDDGSTDGSADVLRELAARDARVRVITLRGNLGKSAALAAGFDAASGELVFTMDSDLQDDPKEIPRFLAKLDEGFDVVCGWKAVRHDPWHKTLPSRVYNGFVASLFGLPLHDVNCGYKLMRADVVKSIPVYGEMHRLIPVLAHFQNFSVGEIPVEHHPRRFGRSKFGLERFSRGALDVLTVWFLSRRMKSPSHFFGKLSAALWIGALLCVAAGFYAWNAIGPSSGVACFAAGVVLAGAGVVTVSTGLAAEFMVRNFVRVDPAFFVKRER